MSGRLGVEVRGAVCKDDCSLTAFRESVLACVLGTPVHVNVSAGGILGVMGVYTGLCEVWVCMNKARQSGSTYSGTTTGWCGCAGLRG